MCVALHLSDLQFALDDNHVAIASSSLQCGRHYGGRTVNVISFLRKRRVGRAVGSLSIATSLLVASAVFPTDLQANSEAALVIAESKLKVPADITEESIEAIDNARVTTRILYITAHPDDESGSVLTYLAREVAERLS